MKATTYRIVMEQRDSWVIVASRVPTRERVESMLRFMTENSTESASFFIEEEAR